MIIHDVNLLNLFLDNKYTRIYISLAQKAKARILKEDEYYEGHHLIPNSFKEIQPDLTNAVNCKDNMVHFTAREHFIAHRLLTKITTGRFKISSYHAIQMFKMKSKHLDGMTDEKIIEDLTLTLGRPPTDREIYKDPRRGRRKLNSHQYEYVKRLLSISMTGENHSQKNKDAVSKALKGVPLTAEHRKKVSDALIETIEAYLVSPDNVQHHTLDVRKFCKEHEISYHTINKRIYTNDVFVIKKGKNKGWMFSLKPISNHIQLRNQAFENRHENLSKSATKQWTKERRKSNRDKTKTPVALRDPHGNIHTFEALSDVKDHQGVKRPVSTIQIAKLNVTMIYGAWKGWTRIS